MKPKYKVQVRIEQEKDIYLSVTHNGYQWTSIYIEDPEAEIPIIISELEQYLNANYNKK